MRKNADKVTLFQSSFKDDPTGSGRLWQIVLVTSIVAITFAPGVGRADTFDQGNSELGNLRIIDPKEARRNDPFAVLHDKPLSESPMLIPQLIALANALPPPYLYELARRLWPTDSSAAMEWFAVGMARARYDAMRCVDTTSRQGIAYLPMVAPDVVKGIESDRKRFGEAGLRALARPDLFVDAVSPVWICMHGMGAINSAIQGKQLTERDWLRSSSEWEGIRQDIHKDMNKYFVEQGRPQDDPIPMTTAKFPQHTLMFPFAAAYGWLDSQHLVTARNEKDSDGKPVKRLVVFSADGKREEIASSAGMWCAGQGVIAYQTAIEKLEDKVQRITLAVGLPDNWSSKTLELRYPFLDNFGAQGFGQSWSLPTNATRQSPFDCHWETNESLSGPKNVNQWFPLLPGHGAILFESIPGAKSVQWVNAKGAAIKLPVDGNNVSLGSFRYLGWKDAYFVSQTWSRFTHKGKALPDCIPAAYLYPKDGRVEAACAPFDPENTSNAVMFIPSRAGWLRATAYRNTAHGMKTGGLYLIRPGGKAEKLLDSNIDTWNLSPDGCRIAIGHRADGSLSSLDVIDLCRES